VLFGNVKHLLMEIFSMTTVEILNSTIEVKCAGSKMQILTSTI
jgi:diacylglycerol kinase